MKAAVCLLECLSVPVPSCLSAVFLMLLLVEGNLQGLNNKIDGSNSANVSLSGDVPPNKYSNGCEVALTDSS